MNKKFRKAALTKIAEQAELTKIAQEASIATEDQPENFGDKLFDLLFQKMVEKENMGSSNN